VARRIGRQILNLWVDDCTPAYRAAVQRTVADHRHAWPDFPETLP
jgi:hypothetical protein